MKNLFCIIDSDILSKSLGGKESLQVQTQGIEVGVKVHIINIPERPGKPDIHIYINGGYNQDIPQAKLTTISYDNDENLTITQHSPVLT